MIDINRAIDSPSIIWLVSDQDEQKIVIPIFSLPDIVIIEGKGNVLTEISVVQMDRKRQNND